MAKTDPKKNGVMNEALLKNLAEAHMRLADADRRRKAGDFDGARGICEALIDEFPDYVGALHTLGLVHIASGAFWPALSCFVRAAMLNPNDWTILTNLAQVYLNLDATELAIQTLERALLRNSENADIHATLGQVYEHEDEYELAARSHERALVCDANHRKAALELGDAYNHLGRIEDAAAAFLRAHRMNPDGIGPLFALAELPPSLVGIDVLAAVERAAAAPQNQSEETQIWVSYARAAAYDKLGAHREAWENLERANAPLFQRYGDEHAKHVRRREFQRAQALAYSFRSDISPIQPAAGDDPLSLFILGPSRCGKTTLEKLCGTLEGVMRGYENPIIDKTVRRTSQASGLLTLHRLSDLPDSLDHHFERNYREALQARSAGAKVLTNTRPGLISDLGRLAETIPQSAFVFVMREHNDIRIRMLMRRYQEDSHHYAYDAKTALGEISWYYEMVAIWMAALPSRCLAVSYDDIVLRPKSVIESVARHCHLPPPTGQPAMPFDDRGCGRPYERFFRLAH